MPLINTLFMAIQKGEPFSANHNGLLPYQKIETEAAWCPSDDIKLVGYIVQQWATKSLYHDNSFITFEPDGERVKIYY